MPSLAVNEESREAISAHSLMAPLENTELPCLSMLSNVSGLQTAEDSWTLELTLQTLLFVKVFYLVNHAVPYNLEIPSGETEVKQVKVSPKQHDELISSLEVKTQDLSFPDH